VFPSAGGWALMWINGRKVRRASDLLQSGHEAMRLQQLAIFQVTGSSLVAP
jgi:hypothetical protein